MKQRCRRLRHQGYSIGHIARALRVSKSTVHWHVRDIPLTAEQQEHLRTQKHALMRRVNGQRRGKPIRPVHFQRPGWSNALVHLMAHLYFDGRIDRYGCAYYSRHYAQASHVKRLLEQLVQVGPKLVQRANGMWVTSFYNVELATWLNQKEHELLKVVSRHAAWQRQWLQALFDDEGHVHIASHVKRVRASQHRLTILKSARRFLASRGIQSRIDRFAHAVEITGRQNLVRFGQQINFAPGLTVNENRKNGLWKQPLKKRQLLQRALDMYRPTTVL